MIPPNQFGNLDKEQIYGMSLDLSINENQSWNPLDMLKQKEHLANKQINEFSIPQLPNIVMKEAKLRPKMN